MTTPAHASLAIAAADELAHAGAILGAELLTINHRVGPGRPSRLPETALHIIDAIASDLRLIAQGSPPTPGFADSAGQRLLVAQRMLADYERRSGGIRGLFEPWPTGVLARYRAARARCRRIGQILVGLADDLELAEPKERFGLA